MFEKPVSGKPHPLRRQYFVNKSYQTRFILSMSGLALVVGAVTATTVYFVVKSALSEAMYRSHLPTGEIWHMIRTPLLWSNVALSGIFFLLAILAVLVLIAWSARALLAIEKEIRNIDTYNSAAYSGASKPLWNGVATKASEDVKRRLQPFEEAAEKLIYRADQLRKPAGATEPMDSSMLAADLDAVLKLIDEGIEAFET